MNAYKNIITFFLLLIASFYCNAGLLDYFTTSAPSENQQAKIRLPLGINERKNQLEHLKLELKELHATAKDFAHTIQLNLDQTSNEIKETKAKLAQASAKDVSFLNKVLSILNETYQTLFNLQFYRKELVSIIEQHTALLENFLKDPDFKSLHLKEQSFYTFDDLQEFNKKVAIQETKINHLTEQKNDGIIALENAKRKLITISKDYEDKKKKQAEFNVKTQTPADGQASAEFDFKELGRITDLEKNLALFEKQLTELKIQELTKKNAFLETSIALENDKLKIIKSNVAHIKDALRIEPKDLQKTKERLETDKKESLALRDTYYSTIKELSSQRENALKELEQLKKRYNVTDITAIGATDWSVVPHTSQEWVRLCELGLKDNQSAMLESKIDTLRATIDLEISKFKRKEIDVEIFNTWYKITRRQFKSNEEILSTLKHYQSLLAELTREENSIKDKRNSLTNLINIRNKNLVNLKTLIDELKKQQSTIFKTAEGRFNTCLSKLNQTEKIIEEQLENNNQLLKYDSDLITLISNTIQGLHSIINELETKSIWQRSEYAISLNGINNIGSDLKYFTKDIQKLGSHFFSNIYVTIRSLLNQIIYHPFNFIIFILKVLLIILCYRFLRKRLYKFIAYIRNKKTESTSIFVFIKTLEVVTSFIAQYFLRIYTWMVLFALIYFDYISDSFLKVLFYLGSIIFFCYITYRFIQYVIKFNKDNNFIFFSPPFQKRFVFVFGLFAYVNIILLLFREGYIAATYHASEFPIILLALYSVLIRTLIIFSIGKEEILNLIPNRGAGWKAVAEFIDRYYYLLLSIIIVLMIISDPYIGGYGNLVSFVLWGTIGTILLIKVLLFIQDYIKVKSSVLFFKTDEETVKERFMYAKTWYGLFVVALFIIFVFLGILLSFKIWGKTFTLKDFSSILNYGLFSTGLDITTGQHIWLTPFKILVILGFICAGFLLAFMINRFVLHRIFQLLPVDIGIQNTVSSLTRYLIIVAAIFLGFNWANLGNLLFVIGVVIGSIGYIVKEPIADFISYFIILVQRPLKIGDLIKINDTLGFVRHITPRSVILRTKNSYTVIMPNAMIINQPVINWNYSRGFIAFDDISFTIPYSIDPLRVKQIIAEVLDANTDILKSPKPIIRLENFGENGYEFMLRGFLSSNKTLEIWDIASEIRFALVQALQKHNISIAVPTRVIFTKPHKALEAEPIKEL